MDAQHAVPADWIARLYPADRVGGAQRVIERHPCCVRPERSRPQSRSSREPTVEAPENDAQENYLPYIDIKFSDAPQHQGGLIFGSAATSDIVLPREAGVSARHLTLTFKDPSKNGRYCLTLRDLGSCQGTTVTYDGQARARRKRFDWIVAGPSFCAEVKTVHIMFHKALWFRLIVNHHAASSPGYREKVERFCRGAAGYGELMGSLDLQSEPTTHPITGVHTPPDDAIVIEQHWNIGNTSQVGPRFWNVSTGEECAALHPSTTAYDKAQWKNLVDTWKRISHQNIVRLVGWVLEPLPRAYLELLPLRTLRQEHETRSFSARDMSLVLRQSLSALVDIHGQQVPLAHGGIGPDSILVQHRGPREGDLHIKLYPAGLSAQASPPPELIGAARPGIPAPAMDIWSLGIAILWLKWGFLPESNIQGCHLAVTRVQTPGADNIDKVLRKMLVIKPEGRSSAAECLGLASRLFGQNQPMSVPIPGLASSSGGQNQRAATRSHQQPLSQLASDSSRVPAPAFPPPQAILWPSSLVTNPARSNSFATQPATSQPLQAHQTPVFNQPNTSKTPARQSLPPAAFGAPHGPLAGNPNTQARGNKNAGPPGAHGGSTFPGLTLAPIRNPGVSAGGGVVLSRPQLPPIASLLNLNTPAAGNNNARPSGAHGSGAVPPQSLFATQARPGNAGVSAGGHNNARPSGAQGGGVVLHSPHATLPAPSRNPVVSAGSNNNNARSSAAHGSGTVPPSTRPPGLAQPRNPGVSAGGSSSNSSHNNAGPSAGPVNPPAPPANQSFVSRPIRTADGQLTGYVGLHRPAAAAADSLVAVYVSWPGHQRINITRAMRSGAGLSDHKTFAAMRAVEREEKIIMGSSSPGGAGGTYLTFERALRLVEEQRLGEELREIVLAAQRACSGGLVPGAPSVLGR